MLAPPADWRHCFAMSVPLSATGVTTGAMLDGVKFGKDVIETDTVVMRSVTGTVRRVRAEHRQLDKFHLD